MASYLKNLDFSTWCKNHPADHDAKWYRELYPYLVFQQIDFSKNKLKVPQSIEHNRTEYISTIKKIEAQAGGRLVTTFELKTVIHSKSQAWYNREWDNTFRIVYSASFDFITVYSKNEDPSKFIVSKFMGGYMEKVAASKSIDISNLLFRTLVLHITERYLVHHEYNTKYPFIQGGLRDLPIHPQFVPANKPFYPLFSQGRENWIYHCFTEEKSHRLAFHVAGQCKKLVVVYCNPTYTRHHRCKYPDTHVISLFEYANWVGTEIKNSYESQIKFLQNHLNPIQEISPEFILHEINNPKVEEYEIQKSDLMESLAIMKIKPKSDSEFFHHLAAMNLLNAWVGKKRRSEQDDKLFKDMYYFKTYLSEAISSMISNGESFANFYFENRIAIVEMNEFQFSFHHLPSTDVIANYAKSDSNKLIEWSGKKLQPIAPLLLSYARAISKNIKDSAAS